MRRLSQSSDRVRVCLLLLLVCGAAGCHPPSSSPAPSPVAHPNLGRWVLIQKGTTLETRGVAKLVVPATAKFEPLARLPLPTGRTPHDRETEDRRYEKYVDVAGPRGRYLVPRSEIEWTDVAPTPISDSAAAALYESLENAIGTALVQAICKERRGNSRPSTADASEDTLLADSITLEKLGAAGFDPAIFPKILDVGSKSYVRLPTWGKPSGSDCQELNAFSPALRESHAESHAEGTRTSSRAALGTWTFTRVTPRRR